MTREMKKSHDEYTKQFGNLSQHSPEGAGRLFAEYARDVHQASNPELSLEGAFVEAAETLVHTAGYNPKTCQTSHMIGFRWTGIARDEGMVAACKAMAEDAKKGTDATLQNKNKAFAEAARILEIAKSSAPVGYPYAPVYPPRAKMA